VCGKRVIHLKNIYFVGTETSGVLLGRVVNRWSSGRCKVDWV
jgi:hypothetical protein